jgi:hypothetical protein
MLVPLAHRRRIYLALIVCLVLPACSNKEPFTPPDLLYLFATYTVGKNPTSVATGDFDEDGITDIVTTNIGNDSISILFGIGDGTLSRKNHAPWRSLTLMAMDEWILLLRVPAAIKSHFILGWRTATSSQDHGMTSIKRRCRLPPVTLTAIASPI